MGFFYSRVKLCVLLIPSITIVDIIATDATHPMKAITTAREK